MLSPQQSVVVGSLLPSGIPQLLTYTECSGAFTLVYLQAVLQWGWGIASSSRSWACCGQPLQGIRSPMDP